MYNVPSGNKYTKVQKTKITKEILEIYVAARRYVRNETCKV